MDRHPGTTGLLRYFEYGHLPPHLQAISKPIGDLAHELVDLLPDGPELSTMLRKFLEGKDCAVRAALDVPPEQLASSRSLEQPIPCPFRVLRVGGIAPGDRGSWLECSLPAGHDGAVHRAADGEAFA